MARVPRVRRVDLAVGDELVAWHYCRPTTYQVRYLNDLALVPSAPLVGEWVLVEKVSERRFAKLGVDLEPASQVLQLATEHLGADRGDVHLGTDWTPSK